jgi:hypothetical protein
LYLIGWHLSRWLVSDWLVPAWLVADWLVSDWLVADWLASDWSMAIWLMFQLLGEEYAYAYHFKDGYLALAGEDCPIPTHVLAAR